MKTKKQKKEFEHEKFETCSLSKEEINTEKDNYVIVVACQGKNIHSLQFAKANFYKDLFEGKMQILQDSILQKSLKNVGNIFEQIGLPMNFGGRMNG